MVSVDATDAEFGFVKLTYEGSASSGEVADLLYAQGVEAQPNFKYYALALDDEETNAATVADADSSLTAQATHLNDPNSGEQWGLNIIRAYDAWDIAKGRVNASAPRPVAVAIIDSGCMVDHPDLKNNIIGTYDTRTGGTNVTDDQNHGTPVAGIIAAEANNNIGVAGVSYNAGLYIVRALHKQGNEFVAESTDVLKAYENVIANKKLGDTKIRVVNMSLGSKRTGSLGEKDMAVMRKIDEAYTTHDILTVSAAGNQDGTLPYRCYPCDFSDNVIGVINLERKDNGSIVRNEQSNYNTLGAQSKQLSTPGTRIYTTTNNGGYGTKTGTSMAAPCVSGVAALAFVANPQLSAASVKNILCSAADDINTPGFDSFTGYGKINAYNAVQLAKGVADVTGPDSVYINSSISLNCPGGKRLDLERSFYRYSYQQRTCTRTQGGIHDHQREIGRQDAQKDHRRLRWQNHGARHDPVELYCPIQGRLQHRRHVELRAWRKLRRCDHHRRWQAGCQAGGQGNHRRQARLQPKDQRTAPHNRPTGARHRCRRRESRSPRHQDHVPPL